MSVWNRKCVFLLIISFYVISKNLSGKSHIFWIAGTMLEFIEILNKGLKLSLLITIVFWVIHVVQVWEKSGTFSTSTSFLTKNEIYELWKRRLLIENSFALLKNKF